MIAPVMVLILLGVVDFSMAAFHRMELESAARSGAQFALLNPTDTTLIQSTVITSSSLNDTDLSVTITEFCECSDGSTVSCSIGCASGNMREYMNIIASYDYVPLFLPNVMTLTGDSVVRTN